MPKESRTAVGRVAKIYGREGELSIQLYDNFPRDFHLSEPLFVEIDKLAVPLFCASLRRKGQQGAVITFCDINTQRRAAEFVGLELSLNANLPIFSADDQGELDEDEIYLEELVGYTARLSEEGSPTATGRIEEFVDGDNPLFRIIVQNQEAWIPAVDELIDEIDTDAQQVSFTLPEGLLALYLE